MKLYDRVALDDGRVGVIIHIYGNGKAYEIEFETPNDTHAHAMETVEEARVVKVLAAV